MTFIYFRYSRFLNAELTGLAKRVVGAVFERDEVRVIVADSNTLIAETSREIDDAVVDDIKRAGIHGQKLETDEARRVLKDAATAMGAVTQRLIRLLKFYLDAPALCESELTRMPKREWSLDQQNWCSCPVFAIAGSVNVYLDPVAGFDISDCTQKALADAPIFYTAMVHLHYAINHRDPRSKWIDAAIAVELAIKEFLCRKEPKLEMLLLHVPSPPIRKLFGTLLEEYAGERSPFVSELDKGATRRNLLVHRPEGEDISAEDADKYVKTADLAILHLLKLLFPDDRVLSYQYDKKLQRLPK